MTTFIWHAIYCDVLNPWSPKEAGDFVQQEADGLYVVPAQHLLMQLKLHPTQGRKSRILTGWSNPLM
jgi:hypothetical protein